ncbi:MAG: hypothetical protein GEV11_00635 [Streptosporangiales bacterium]|nr:hypothetical protein [Streptosporangiales bacterium]
MGFLDALFGRSKPKQPDLDRLFALPSAAITLQAATGFVATGAGSVSFRAAEGGAFSAVQQDITALLDMDSGPKVEQSTDDYGYTWLVCRHTPDDMGGLVTDLHAVNSTLESNGFGPSLLCSLVAFERDDRRLALVYLYKRGSFYPFAPLPGERRDNALELEARGALAGDLNIEPDLSRWFPVWGAPGV